MSERPDAVIPVGAARVAARVGGALLDEANKRGKVPTWAAHLINTLATVVSLFLGAQYFGGPETAPAPAAAVDPVTVNADGTMTVTKEQRAAWRAAWTQHARQQVLRDIAMTIREDHSPQAVLNLVLGLAYEATAPAPADPAEVQP